MYPEDVEGRVPTTPMERRQLAAEREMWREDNRPPAEHDQEAIQRSREEIARRFPTGSLISVQGPDHGFLDLKKGASMEYDFYFLDHPGSRRIRQHQVIADSRKLAEAMCCVFLFHRWPNFVMLPADSQGEAVAFMRAAG